MHAPDDVSSTGCVSRDARASLSQTGRSQEVSAPLLSDGESSITPFAVPEVQKEAWATASPSAQNAMQRECTTRRASGGKMQETFIFGFQVPHYLQDMIQRYEAPAQTLRVPGPQEMLKDHYVESYIKNNCQRNC